MGQHGSTLVLVKVSPKGLPQTPNLKHLKLCPSGPLAMGNLWEVSHTSHTPTLGGQSQGPTHVPTTTGSNQVTEPDLAESTKGPKT